MSFRFEKLDIWKLAREYVADIYKITKSFPKSEFLGLTPQIRRAATSIVLNIAEGSDRKSDIEFRRFLRMSLTSLEEPITGLYIALDQEFISQENFNLLYAKGNELAAKINALIKALKEM